MSKFNPQIHHRRSIRLQGYDYTQPGAYFITLATQGGKHLFGEIASEEMQLSPLGQIAQEEWLRSGVLRAEICLNEDEFVVMPNHLHGIVWIVDVDKEGADDGTDAIGAHRMGAHAVRPYPKTEVPAEDATDAFVRADGIRPSLPEDERDSDVRRGAHSMGAHTVRPYPRTEVLAEDATDAFVRADGVRPSSEDACDSDAFRRAHAMGAHTVRPYPETEVPAEDITNAFVRADGVRPSSPEDARPGAHTVSPYPGAEVPAEGARRAPLQVDGVRPSPLLYRPPRSLPSFIAGYKAAVSSRASREVGIQNVWLRNYYEHIIRSEPDFHRIWDYIDNNPLRWQDDPLNPWAPPNPFNQE